MSSLSDLLPDILQGINDPVIAAQPQADVTVSKNSAFIITVVAISNTTMLYQWKKDGEDLPGEVGPTLAVAQALITHMGVYTCAVTNDYSTVISEACTVTVKVPPTIVTQPEAAVKNVGETFTLSVVATGTATLAYQWYKDDVVISAATSASYTKTNAQTTHSGVYTCMVSNVCGSLKTIPVTVTVNAVGANPVITTQPVGGEFSVNDAFVLTVVATNAVSYQWEKNESEIRGATSATYSIGSAVEADSGSYVCVVTNGSGSTDSVAAVVSVVGRVPVVISTTVSGDGVESLISDLIVFDVSTAGGATPAVSLTVTVSGTTPLAYQWLIDQTGSVFDPTCSGIREIRGATSSTYSFTAEQASEGIYKCRVTNAFGSVFSGEVLVCVDSIAFTIVDPVATTVQEGQPLWVYSECYPILAVTHTHAWVKNGVAITPQQSGQVYVDPATLPSYIHPRSNYGILYYKGAAELSDAGTYTLQHSFPRREDTFYSPPARLEVSLVGFAPVIATQATSAVIAWGESFRLFVTATGTLPTYQWYRDGAAIADATSSSYDVAVTELSVGTYTCVVSNDYGSVTSAAIALSIA